RYCARYAVDAVGLAAPGGRKSRRAIAVDVGEARAPAAADGRVAIPPQAEVDTLGAMRANIQGRAVGTDAPLKPAIALVREMTTARYVALVADAEPGATPADPDRAEALTALAQALNGPTRCALSMLCGGGNRSGRMRCSRSRRGSRSRWTSDAGTRRTGRTRARPSGWRGA